MLLPAGCGLAARICGTSRGRCAWSHRYCGPARWFHISGAPGRSGTALPARNRPLQPAAAPAPAPSASYPACSTAVRQPARPRSAGSLAGWGLRFPGRVAKRRSPSGLSVARPRPPIMPALATKIMGRPCAGRPPGRAAAAPGIRSSHLHLARHRGCCKAPPSGGAWPRRILHHHLWNTNHHFAS